MPIPEAERRLVIAQVAFLDRLALALAKVTD
jgi:hypothetical protein